MNTKTQRYKGLIKRMLGLQPVAVIQHDDGRQHATIPNAVLIPMALGYLKDGQHTVTIPLKGNSMRPFLVHMRDNAILSQVKEINVGDPVLAETAPEHYVLHRVIAIDGDDITLRGDGNFACEYCKRGDVKAIATGFLRKGRKTPDLITSRKWRWYSWWWMRLFPMRGNLLRLHHLFFRSLKVLDD